MSLELTTEVKYLKGVGPARAKVLENMAVKTVEDLLYYFPRRHLDRTTVTSIRDCRPEMIATVTGKVEVCGKRRARNRSLFEAVISDGTGLLKLVWFNAASYWNKTIKIGEFLAVHGKVEMYNGFQIVHPELDKLDKEDDPLHSGKIVPLYPLTQHMKNAGLENRRLRSLIASILNEFPVFPDILSEAIRTQFDLTDLSKALQHIHYSSDQIKLQAAIKRLKFDEHFFLQLLMALRRKALQKESTRSLSEVGPYFERITDQMEFELTNAQKRVIKEIRSDLAKSVVMNRLLQGDVGSGKTIVALLSAAIAIGNGSQVAIMAPTEILAHQHYESFQKYAEQAKITCAILVGNTAASQRKGILTALTEGRIQLIVGTHALIQKDVKFKDLSFVVIDEQHRFGVMQRGDLTSKGLHPHVLSMTATPIPRTLAMSYHGDMDVSIIDEMPKDRIPVRTKVVDPSRLISVYKFVIDEVSAGRQCMIVYPLVEESEKSDLAAASEDHEKLAATIFKDLKVGLIHGRMKKDEKDAVMDAFSANEIQILVATTVIEVGIDVPNATVMIIEHADRFGLTQLHQLRGRVGRGTDKGYCVLVKRNHTDTAVRRLGIMEKTTDGFKIADEDLAIRGPGEFFGIRQSGFFKYKIADLVHDGPLIRQARQAAFEIAEKDPHLRHPQHHLLRQRFIKDYQDKLKLVNIT